MVIPLAKRPIPPVVGDHFVDPRTPEMELFGEEMALRPLLDVETAKSVPKKKQRANAIHIPDETRFRLQKWKQKLKYR